MTLKSSLSQINRASPRGEDDELSVISSVDTLPSLPSKPPRIHPRYYVNDNLTVFLVSNEVLFRVHRHVLDRESAKFRSFLTGTEDDPVPLKDVCPEEFETLLDYFYDSAVHGETPRSREEWIHLLSISHQFEMEKVYNRAVAELEKIHIDPIDKIVLAVKHGVSAWLYPAYTELCKREEPLSDEDAVKLDIRTMARLARARETIRMHSEIKKARKSVMCSNCAEDAYTPIDDCAACGDPMETLDDTLAASTTAELEQIVANVFEEL